MSTIKTWAAAAKYAAMEAIDLAAMAVAGDLPREHLWMAVEGAQTYRRAVAQGLVATADEAHRRAGLCAQCPSHTTAPSSALPSVLKGSCGPFLLDRTADPDPAQRTCGCRVTLTVGGLLTPAGKTVAGNERCPQGRW